MMAFHTKAVSLLFYITFINCLHRTELSTNVRETNGRINSDTSYRVTDGLKCKCQNLITAFKDLQEEFNRTRGVFKTFSLSTNKGDKNMHISQNDSISSVSTCLESANYTDKWKCLRNDSKGDSFVMDTDGNIYKNIFCLKCNNKEPCRTPFNNSTPCEYTILQKICSSRRRVVEHCPYLKETIATSCKQIKGLFNYPFKNNSCQNVCNKTIINNVKYLSKCLLQDSGRQTTNHKQNATSAKYQQNVSKTPNRKPNVFVVRKTPKSKLNVSAGSTTSKHKPNATALSKTPNKTDSNKRKTDFERCFLRNSTMFIILNGKTVINSSRLMKMVFSTMKIKEVLSNRFSIVYENNERIIIKIRCEATNDHFSKLQNISYLLNDNETLIFHSLDSSNIRLRNDNEQLLLNKDCTIAKPLNFSRVSFTNSCDVLYMDRIIENISMWVSLTSNDTKRYVYTCKKHGVDIDWPFTIFIAGLICILFYYFCRTICYKNQGYIRTYYVNSTNIFLSKPNFPKVG